MGTATVGKNNHNKEAPVSSPTGAVDFFSGAFALAHLSVAGSFEARCGMERVFRLRVSSPELWKISRGGVTASAPGSERDCRRLRSKFSAPPRVGMNRESVID